jgi:hypothetical protein
MASRRRRADEILSAAECAIIGANIRVLRQRNVWPQAKLGELMGWPANSTVCAAEGHRNGRQRRFTSDEVERLADIFDLPIWQLTRRCVNCDGHPPAGFSCLSCGAGQKIILEMSGERSQGGDEVKHRPSSPPPIRPQNRSLHAPETITERQKTDLRLPQGQLDEGGYVA